MSGYAKGGWAIAGDVVIGILEKNSFTKSQLKQCLSDMQYGALLHLKWSVSRKESELKEAKEYAKVIVWIEKKL